MSDTNTPPAPAAPAMPPTSVVAPAPAAAAPTPAPAEAPAHVENAGQVGPGKSDAPAIGPDGAPGTGEPVAGEAEPAPAEAAPPAAEPPPAPEPIVYADFKLPDGVTVVPAQLSEATKVLAKYGVPQEQAQELISLHANGLKQALETYSRTAADYWNGKAKDWVAEAKDDPVIGGNRFATSLSLARGVWTEVLPDKADRDRLFADLTDTKIGDHPVLTRAMAEIGRRLQQVMTATGTTTWAAAMKKIREPAAPPPGRPARAPGANGSPADKRYQPRAG